MRERENPEDVPSCLAYTIVDYSFYMLRVFTLAVRGHINREHPSPAVQKEEPNVSKNQSTTRFNVCFQGGRGLRFLSEWAEVGQSGRVLQHNFWPVWPSPLGQTQPPFVALGPLWQCIDSLRCMNSSDTG